MINETIQETMTRKTKIATRSAEIAMAAVKLLESLEQYVPADKLVMFQRSIKLPLIRRHQKTAGQSMFWNDQEAVEIWMSKRVVPTEMES